MLGDPEPPHPELVAELKRRSTKRVDKSEDFQRVRRQITRYKERKGRTEITLNAEKFLAERAKLKEDRSDKPKVSNRPKAEVAKDYYLEEALAISLDYIRLLAPSATVLH